MKSYITKINQIISQIDEIHREVIVQKPFYDDENREEALDELTSAASTLEDLCYIFERNEADQDAKNQMNLNL